MKRFLIAVMTLSGFMGTTGVSLAQNTSNPVQFYLSSGQQAKDAPGQSNASAANPQRSEPPIADLPVQGSPIRAETQSSPTTRKGFGVDRAPYGRGYLDFGGDVLIPRNSQEYLTSAGGGGVGMGIRPIRYLQTGFTAEFFGNFNGTPTTTAPFTCTSGCTGTYNETLSARGNLMAIDGRGVLPLLGNRLQISGGGGIAWLEASTTINTGGVDVQQVCPPVCTGSQRGHGPTEIVDIKYFPGNGHLGLGFHVRAMQIKSPSGLNFSINGGGYNDHFLSIGGQISFQFGMHGNKKSK